MTIRILLADDHHIVREGARSLIEKEPDMAVIAEARDGETAVRLATELRPDVVIMDIAMSRLNGIDATSKLNAANVESKIIALSMHDDRCTVLKMLSAGASGYLPKECAPYELILAIKTVMSGGMYLSPTVAERLLNEREARQDKTDSPDEGWNILQLLAAAKCPEDIAALLERDGKHILKRLVLNTIISAHPGSGTSVDEMPAIFLSAREREILDWIRQGKNTWEMASILSITENTVKYHLRNIYQKLHVANRAEAVAAAIERNLIDRKPLTLP